MKISSEILELLHADRHMDSGAQTHGEGYRRIFETLSLKASKNRFFRALTTFYEQKLCSIEW